MWGGPYKIENTKTLEGFTFKVVPQVFMVLV
jgi:hypothetical protein